MLLPDKHLPVGNSVLGVGAYLIGILLDGPMDLDTMALEFSQQRKGQSLGALTTELLLALSFLYSIGTIDMDESGRVFLCD